MLDQRLQQKLGLKFSPQQIQLMKLLQVPTANLEQRIKEELESNPALEEGESDDDQIITPDETPTDEPTLEEPMETEAEQEAQEEELKVDDEMDMSDYYDEDDEGVADYKTKDSSEYQDPDDENKHVPVATTSSFHEYLETQLSMLDIDDRQEQIAMHLIGSLDDDGYLRRELDAILDDLSFRQGIQCNERELKEVLEQVQKLDPPGVGARNLEECLLIQLKRKEEPTIYTEIAIRVVEKYFDLFAKKHYDKLERAFDIDSDKLKKVVDEITRLNPKPGSAFSGGGGEQYVIIPDFILSNNAG
ncbi:MAG: RNA polymerase sigma-54 factor, partial [Chitinophagales bacterium]|nr:RNA polymerase sigma-54 factor [Chitinophagales bacterium]